MLWWFSYFLIVEKSVSAILELVTLSSRLLSKLRLGTISLKSILNVSASSSLFIIFLLLSFNVMYSLWKFFLEKIGLLFLQNFLLSVTTLFLSFRNSLFYFYAKYSRRDFLVYSRRLFTPYILSRNYLFNGFP